MRIPAALDAALDLLACPVCRSRGLPEAGLLREAGQLRCAEGHSFDIARQGHVNLANGPEPANADSQEMVAARERFLGSGAYLPLREALLGAFPDSGGALEVGAGPGWYLAGVLAAHPGLTGLATDVSVAAARRAARRGLAAIVADTWVGLPVLSASLQALLCVFAPRNAGEFARVLRPGARLVVASPTERHLAGLRERLGLLDVEPGKQQALEAQMAAAGLAAGEHRLVEFTVACDAEQVRDLVAMGPNAFHRHRVETGPARVDVSVSVDVFAAAAAKR